MIRIINLSYGTQELGPAMYQTLRTQYPHMNFIHVGAVDYDTTDLQILICPAGLGSELAQRKPKKYITYQLEPYQILEREHYRQFLEGALFNWDYSPLNVEKGNAKYPNLKLRHLPLGYCPAIQGHLRPYLEDNRQIDVLFLGYADAYPRRVNIVKNLKSFCHVYNTHECNTQDMQRLIQRAKICVNIHIYDNFVLQTVRMNVLLSNKACIISERSEDKVAEADYEPGVVFTDDLEKTIKQYLADFPARQEQAERSYAWYKSRPWKIDLPAELQA